NGKPVMEVGDRSISEKEFRRQLALMQLPNILPAAIEIPDNSRLLATHYLGETFMESQIPKTPSLIVRIMAGYLQPSVGEPERFIANRINIQKGGIEFGVTPSNDEVENFVETVIFTDTDGNFDLEAYDKFTKSRLGNIGGIPGFNNYIRDLLTAQNLSKVLGGGISTEINTERELFDVQKQEISGSKITLESGVYEGLVKPTEEEIREYYEENSQKYNSDELRKITYVSIEPDWDKALKKSKDAKATADAEEAERLKKAEEAARKVNEAAKATEEPEPAEKTAEPQPETITPTEGSTIETDDSAKEVTETETPRPPATDGSQGDPGKSGEPAPTPIPSDSTDPTLESDTAKEDPTAGEIGQALEDAVSNETSVNPLTPTPAPLKPVVEETPAKPQTPKEQLNGAEKQEAVEALSSSLEEFYQKLLDNEGEDFEAIAKDSGYEIKKSEFFSKADPPKELSGVIESLQIGKISDAAFELPENGDSDEKLSDPYRTSDGWFLIRLDEVEESLPLTFEQTKVQVTVDLKKKMAREQMIKEANELFGQLTEKIEAGKSFVDAAKELDKEVTEITGLAEGQTFNFGQRSQKLPDPPEFVATQYTNPGEISPVYFSPSEEEATQAQLIFVEKRELAKKDEFETDFGTLYESITSSIRFVALSNWLYDSYKTSGVTPPEREGQQ
ncbi:peptidyl-prolyl cis-trans isomerase, partial [Akkermansiaceae bacterium]|nr:peptidyl-prolyl cis-trans isomerase [Akkermansiaceae bacterium]